MLIRLAVEMGKAETDLVVLPFATFSKEFNERGLLLVDEQTLDLFKSGLGGESTKEQFTGLRRVAGRRHVDYLPEHSGLYKLKWKFP